MPKRKRRRVAGTWKHKERDLAALFGTARRPLSGGNSSHAESRDDAEHDRLYLECKYSVRHALFSLWRFCRQNTRREARRSKRRVVIGLYERGQPEALLLLHQDDLLHVAIERLIVLFKNRDLPWNVGEAQDLLHKLQVVADTLC